VGENDDSCVRTHYVVQKKIREVSGIGKNPRSHENQDEGPVLERHTKFMGGAGRTN